MAHRFPVEKIAKLDSAERHARQPAAPLVEVVAESSPKKVVDLGAGTGYFAVPIAQRLPDCIVTCIDIELAMLEPLEQKATEGGVVDRMRALLVSEAEGANLPVMDQTFDLFLLAHIYHELEDRAASLREVWRGLKPGGRVVICDWSTTGTTDAGPPIEHRVPVAKVEEELRLTEFTAVERRTLYDDFITVVAARPS